MTSRRHLLRAGAIAGTALTAASSAVRDQGKEAARTLDKLTDESGKYAAAPLPYAYDALEPVIDARTVELHYNFHHKPAAAAANKAEEALAAARDSGDFALVRFHEKELAFQLSSHLLHTIYWSNLSGKGGEPRGDLLKALSTQFDSNAKCKAHLTAAAAAVEASGWACSAITRRPKS